MECQKRSDDSDYIATHAHPIGSTKRSSEAKTLCTRAAATRALLFSGKPKICSGATSRRGEEEEEDKKKLTGVGWCCRFVKTVLEELHGTVLYEGQPQYVVLLAKMNRLDKRARSGI
ncbi:MAG: hypothetical protein FRX49_10313 [Trebouxia sp. A1-2]|nr:MAG: hypothetical protein FRX49_10313 [Trebouxia sp. A1-2]